MRIVHIVDTKRVKKTKKELEKEAKNVSRGYFTNDYKSVKLKNPSYIVEMSIEEFQLISFYLELEKREPIMNIKVNTELQGKEENNADKQE